MELYGELAEQDDIIEKISPPASAQRNTSSKSPPQKNNAPVNTMNTRNPHTRKSCRLVHHDGLLGKQLMQIIEWLQQRRTLPALHTRSDLPVDPLKQSAMQTALKQ